MEKFKCSNCGKLIPEDASICPYCGSVFEEEELTNNKKFSSLKNEALIVCQGLDKISGIYFTIGMISAVILFLAGFITSVETNEVGYFLVFIVYSLLVILASYVSKYVFKWMAYTLNCLLLLVKKK